MAEWFGVLDFNAVTWGSNPALATEGVVLGSPWFYSSAILVNSQLVCLPASWDCYHVYLLI